MSFRRLFSIESTLLHDDIQSGDATDTTRVPTQKVQNISSRRLIALKFFEKFLKAVLQGVEWTCYPTMTYGRVMPPT